MQPFEVHLESNWQGANWSALEETIMKREIRALLITILIATPLAAGCYAGNPWQEKGKRNKAKYEEKLKKEVRHQLVMLPWYSVFDDLKFEVRGDKVTLYGSVARPSLKSDAEAAVKSIEGVASVENKIEVLPLSGMDDQLRRALYRAIYGEAGMWRYAMSALPAIHIIVKNGNVTLEGVVDNEMDKNLANLRANQVPNVFSVKNNLVVVSGEKK